jgi:hypothetical protein
MNDPFSSLGRDSSQLRSTILAVLAAALSVAMLAGCGSGGMVINPGPPPPVLNGTTTVAVMLSSTANDKLSSYILQIQSITLANAAGKSVTLFPGLLANEFIHGNSSPQLFWIVVVPQDTYTSAAVTFTNPQFALIDTALHTSTFSILTQDQARSATIDLPVPLTVSGNAMTLDLDLQVAQSFTLQNTTPFATFTITPVFNLTASPVMTQPASSANGKVTAMLGSVVSVNAGGNSLNVQNENEEQSLFETLKANTSSFTVTTNANTVFQGIDGLTFLNAGMFLNLDANIQSDGSLLATRIEVEDVAASHKFIGPLTQIINLSNNIAVTKLQELGTDVSFVPLSTVFFQLDGNTVFKTSGSFSNPQNLPFTPTFDSGSTALAQHVSVASAAIARTGGQMNLAKTVTLVSQTINGTIASVSASSTFQVFDVTLASYDPITAISGASTVVVYVPANTQVLANGPLTAGSVARFTGLLFNDHGTLRLVASEVNTGVAE